MPSAQTLQVHVCAADSLRFCVTHAHALCAKQDTSLKELRQGMKHLEAEVSERTGQHKELIKRNFERFIRFVWTLGRDQFGGIERSKRGQQEVGRKREVDGVTCV